MPVEVRKSPWDFSEAYEVLQSSSIATKDRKDVTNGRSPSRNGLGNFSQIWQALGVEANDFAIQPNHGVPNPNAALAIPPREETYASDGGVTGVTSRKIVSWNDEPEILDATDAPTTPTSEEGPDSIKWPSMTKKERKKLRKKQRKEEKKRLEEARLRKTTSDIESESEIRILQRPTPATKASKHTSASVSSERLASAVDSRPVPAPLESNAAPTITIIKREKEHSPTQPERPVAPKQLPIISTHRAYQSPFVPSAIPQPLTRTPTQQLSQTLHSQFGQASTPPHLSHTSPAQVAAAHVQQSQRQASPSLSQPYGTQSPSYQSGLQHMYDSPSIVRLAQTFPFPNCPVSQRAGLTQPVSQQFPILETAERNFQLFLRLVHSFPEDKSTLTQLPLANHNATPSGIHVFVDFSNIWIGFMDHLKALSHRFRQRIPHQNLSFDALVRILERGRPTAKRVLAGSAPLVPAVELAEKIGYECLILDKVYKQRVLSEKKRRELALQGRNSFGALGTKGASSSSLSLHPFAPTSMPSAPIAPPVPLAVPGYAPEKWVEQGVDEMLHLQMANSVLDADEPSVMVVATGDAAKAEYSEGFLHQIVRAMKKGWHVELVAWSKSIGREYRSDEFLAQWDEQFRIIQLDDWAQFLLDT